MRTIRPFDSSRRDVDLDFLPELVREAVGSGVRIVRQERLAERAEYVVLACTLAGAAVGKVVLKLAGPGAPRWTRAEAFDGSARLARLARDNGVPVAEVLAVDTSAARWPVRYVVTGWLPGMTWDAARAHMTEANRPALFGDLGAAVARMHTIGFDAFGGGTYVAALRRRVDERVGNEAHRDLFERVMEAHAADLGKIEQAALTHEDLNHSNLLVEPREDGGLRLSGILDFDAAWAGNPESDLARLELWRGMMHPAFWAAYRAEAPISDGYESRRAVLQLLWCLEYAAPTAQHHADTAGVCATLGLPAITFA